MAKLDRKLRELEEGDLQAGDPQADLVRARALFKVVRVSRTRSPGQQPSLRAVPFTSTHGRPGPALQHPPPRAAVPGHGETLASILISPLIPVGPPGPCSGLLVPISRIRFRAASAVLLPRSTLGPLDQACYIQGACRLLLRATAVTPQRLLAGPRGCASLTCGCDASAANAASGPLASVFSACSCCAMAASKSNPLSAGAACAATSSVAAPSDCRAKHGGRTVVHPGHVGRLQRRHLLTTPTRLLPMATLRWAASFINHAGGLP
jgi:hypothetical protein